MSFHRQNDGYFSRRQFLSQMVKAGAVAGATLATGVNVNRVKHLHWTEVLAGEPLAEIVKTAPQARYWTSFQNAPSCLTCHTEKPISDQQSYPHANGLIKCLLCAQGCVLKPGERGRCRARLNVDGIMRSLVYGRPVSIHVDPIEKKPFYHFLPGSQAYSFSTCGCPLSCKFCQNWEISQARPEDFDASFISPQIFLERALQSGAPVLASTYNEPTISTEYLIDVAELAKKHKMRTVIVSCGIMNQEPLTDMCKVLDAVKIDLKGFSEDFYHQVSGATLKPILRSIQQVARSGVHLEIVNLMVPTLNDSIKMMTDLSTWVFNELGPDVPIHFTRFHPDYQLLNLPPTPIPTLEKARDIAMQMGIHYAYIGNVPGSAGNHTYCPKCKKAVIERSNMFVTAFRLIKGQCPYCQFDIAGVWT